MDGRARELGDRLPALVERLVASYHADDRTHRIDCEFVPSKAEILTICDDLLELTFPGFYGRTALSTHNISYHVGELIPRLYGKLVHEIDQALCFERERCGEHVASATEQRCTQQAIAMTEAFLTEMPNVRARLAEDVQAAFDGDPAARNTQEIILAYPALVAITIYRYANELFKADVPLIPRIMTEHAHRLTGIDIHPGATIGRRFFIDHGTGVVIGETTVIGDNVKIYQGVTLGALSFPKDERGRVIRGAKRHPTVGNNVTIYANAIVLGGDTLIGDDAVIGGSVFLTQSVEPGHQVSITPPVLRFRPRRGHADKRDDAPPPPDWVI
jgi:serine O-acetyltransferase